MATRRSFLLAGLTLVACAYAAPLRAAAEVVPPVLQTPMLFIAALGDQTLAVIRGNAPTQQKMAYFHLLLQQDFDIPGVAPSVLGPYWRVATDGERQEFVQLLESYILVTFGRRLADYGGQTLRVTGSRGTQSDPIVISEISRPGAAPLRLEWVLTTRKGVYQISDVIVDGVSMITTQRSEFASIIARTGGTIAGLLVKMRQIIAEAACSRA